MSKNSRDYSQPHDSLFKEIMGDMDAAKDFLSFWLPEKLKKWCDFETIKSEPTSFKDTRQDLVCDMLFSIRLKNSKRRLYVIAEHQSGADKEMSFRVLGYKNSVAVRCFRETGNMPLIFPVVLYHGKHTPYPYATSFINDLSPDIAEYVYENPLFKLADITTMADQDLMTHGRVAAMEMALKHTYKEYTDIGQPVQFLCNMQELKDRYGDKYEHLFNPCLWYWYDQSGVFKKFGMDELSQAVPENVREGIMAQLQSWTSEIRLEGRLEGEQIGEQKLLSVAQNLVNAGMPYQDVMKFTGITSDKLEALKKNAASNDASFDYQANPAPALKSQPVRYGATEVDDFCCKESGADVSEQQKNRPSVRNDNKPKL